MFNLFTKNTKKILRMVLFTGLGCLLACIALANSVEGKTAVVNTAVSNLYEKPDNNSQVVSQAIYYTPVKVLQTQHGFSLVQTQDHYQGWIGSKELLEDKVLIPNARIAQAKNLFVNIYQNNSISSSQPILVVPFSTRLPLIAVVDKIWVKVQLANGVTGWVQRGDVILDPKPISLQEMLELSRRFVGIQYAWGGVSSFGFDCSGFVQMLFKHMGVFLPRDTNVQVYWPGFVEVLRKDLRPGDVLYFGWDNKVSHTGIYLGNNKFINATTYQDPIVQISDINESNWKDILLAARRLDPNSPPAFYGKSTALPESVKQEMKKYSWRQGCPVPLENLSYLTMSYWGFDNKPHQGTMIVHQDVAPEVLEIFKELYQDKFPITKMQPIDKYRANDNASMVDDNTSAFNCRAMTDFPDQYSVHSYGKAIDVNPLINPYVNNGKVDPKEGAKYQDRTTYQKGKIIRNSKIYEIFIKHGWMWGGDWQGGITDFQHFEKPLKK